ncbi:carboxylesterase family protein [Penicillium malachiteum]|uniref:Carboxylesterase family protein n=1 Tax=Penicillium malachiteum TaxID=1324776 RepID=A0AAD6HFN6_9EURO|nr:carboxylesterase family protein [Penicillium malachiteum]
MPSLYRLGIGLLACAGSVLGEIGAPTAKTKNGTYYGTPVGDLRFRDPQSLNTSWSGERNATEMGYMCYGYGPTQQVLGEYVSEDCLTLNIFRSNNGTSTSKLLPVVVYIHGGLFKHGSGRDPRYNMTSLLQVAVQNDQQFIGVTLNYRLSYWGFLYGQEVAEEGVANLGLKDQRLALQWVSENIKAFGGDPEKITIWGQEAGVYSVGLQLLACGGRDDGLFRGAVAQSGSPTLMWPSVTAKEWQPLYNKL